MTLPKRTFTAACTAAALLAPVAAQAKGGGDHPSGSGPDNATSHRNASAHVKGPKFRTVIVKGTVTGVDGDVVTVNVTRANHHGRALRNQAVQLDVTDARLKVRDVNGDGNRDVGDVVANDRVVAQVRIPRGSTPDLTTAFPARKLIDVGPKPAPDSGSTDSTDSQGQQPAA